MMVEAKGRDVALLLIGGGPVEPTAVMESGIEVR